MAATCAVCLRPIRGAREFVLHRTEVVHRACVRNLDNTLRVQHEHEITRLRGIVAQLEIERDAHLATARTDKAQLRANLETDIAVLRRDLIALEDTSARVQRERDELRTRMKELTAERDMLRNQAAMTSALGPPRTTPTPPVPAPPPTPAPPAPEDDLEAAQEKRTSLLELD